MKAALIDIISPTAMAMHSPTIRNLAPSLLYREIIADTKGYRYTGSYRWTHHSWTAAWRLGDG
jgi:hypothetical protein